MLFTVLYIVTSVNRFDTKLRLLLLFCSIKRKNVQISKFVLGFEAQLYMEKG